MAPMRPGRRETSNCTQSLLRRGQPEHGYCACRSAAEEVESEQDSDRHVPGGIVRAIGPNPVGGQREYTERQPRHMAVAIARARTTHSARRDCCWQHVWLARSARCQPRPAPRATRAVCATAFGGVAATGCPARMLRRRRQPRVAPGWSGRKWRAGSLELLGASRHSSCPGSRRRVTPRSAPLSGRSRRGAQPRLPCDWLP